jgi:cellobiose-specific phosphotransferase system component IIA
MDLSAYNIVLTSLGAISGVATAWYSILEVKKQLKKAHKARTDEILEEAKLYDKLIRDKLELRVDLLETQLHNLVDSIAKDLEHVKESQTNKIESLSSKVDDLRVEIREAHGNLISLLTTLVNKN